MMNCVLKMTDFGAQVICLPLFLKHFGTPKTFQFAAVCNFWPLLMALLSHDTTFTIPWPWGCGGVAELNWAYVIVSLNFFTCLHDAPSKLVSFYTEMKILPLKKTMILGRVGLF